MKPHEALELMGHLKAAYPRQDLTRETCNVYAAMLSDLSYESAQAAVRRHICLNQWFPSIAELRRVVLEVRGTGAPLAGDAWAEAIDQARRAGYRNGNAPKFSHPAIDRTVRAVGWNVICHSPDHELGYVRKFFLDTYEDFRRREDAQAITTPNVEGQLEAPEAAKALPARAGQGEFVSGAEVRTCVAEALDLIRRKVAG